MSSATTTAGQAAAAAAAASNTTEATNTISTSNTNNVAIQTASLNDQSMMTYMPPEPNNNVSSTGASGTNATTKQDGGFDDADAYNMMDEQQFNSSLDAFLDMEQQANNSSSTTQQQPQHASVVAPASVGVPTTSVGGGDSSGMDKKGFASSTTATTTSMLTQRLAYPGMMAPPTTTQQQQLVAAPSTMMPHVQPYGSITSSGKKRPDFVVSENEEERKRRKRHDRNMREQQRSHKITQQIANLRQVLESAKVQFKPDKYSTLVSVVEYIKQLQQRSAMLDAQHQTLLDTISKTGQLVQGDHHGGPSTPPPTTTLSSNSALLLQTPDSPTSSSSPHQDALLDNDNDNDMMVFVRGLDYKRVFTMCGIALAVASIDGRFMDCNVEFEHWSGYSRNELLPNKAIVVVPSENDNKNDDATSPAHPPTAPWPPQRNNLSLFNLFSRQDMEKLFLAMSDMLKRPFAEQASGGGVLQDYWSGSVRQNRKTTTSSSHSNDNKLQMNITLVRSPQGRPKFFCCALTPCADGTTTEEAFGLEQHQDAPPLVG